MLDDLQLYIVETSNDLNIKTHQQTPHSTSKTVSNLEQISHSTERHTISKIWKNSLSLVLNLPCMRLYFKKYGLDTSGNVANVVNVVFIEHSRTLVLFGEWVEARLGRTARPWHTRLLEPAPGKVAWQGSPITEQAEGKGMGRVGDLKPTLVCTSASTQKE